MTEYQATALAHPNIALIKYWGNKDHEYRIPENGSISFNLGSLQTKTKVTFNSNFEKDQLIINQTPIEGPGLKRVSHILGLVRELSGKPYFAQVTSENNFPMGAGIASSAAAFAALSLAASSAIGLHLNEKDLSRLARRGSGSACRSIPGGFVEWFPGSTDQNSFAASFANSSHWNLVDLIVVVNNKHKSVGSTAGHALAPTSPLQTSRLADVQRRLSIVKNAILKKDFEALAETVEQDSNIMHAVMMTSNPPLFYWEPASINLMKKVPGWRSEGLAVCYTMDAGPNVHLICEEKDAKIIEEKVKTLDGIQTILCSEIGDEAKILKENI